MPERNFVNAIMDSYDEISFQNASFNSIEDSLENKCVGDNVCDELVTEESNSTSCKMTFADFNKPGTTNENELAVSLEAVMVQQNEVLVNHNTFLYVEDSPIVSEVTHTFLTASDINEKVISDSDTIPITLSHFNSSTSELVTDVIDHTTAVNCGLECSILKSILNDVGDISVGSEDRIKNDDKQLTLLDNNKKAKDKRIPKVISQTPENINRRKNEEQHECKICGKSFKEKSHLTTHSRAHLDIRNFSCDVCGLKFKTKANLYFHSQTHSESPFTCTECNKTFAKKKMLKQHIRVVHSCTELHKCNQCDKTFKSAANLSLHYTLHTGSKPFRCSICPKSFVYKNTLAVHISQHHQCTTCLPSTACRHRARPWLCTVCGKGYSLKATLNTHMKTHDPEKLFKCTECSKSFIKKQPYEAHMKKWHSAEGPQYKCDQCSQSYYNIFTLKKHYTEHTSQRNFICEICSKTFSMKDALKVHMRSHTSVKPFQCTKFPKTFVHKHTLDDHLNSHSDNEKDFTNTPDNNKKSKDNSKCDKGVPQKPENINKSKTVEHQQHECKICGKTFREKSHLATHSRAHVDIRNFSCDVCGLRFKTKANLYFHSQTHSETPFTCTECNKTFSERKILKRHIRVVHSCKELHKCNQCDKTFKSAANLSLHYTLHTGSKPFRCSICPKSFVYKSTLAMHISQQHQCTTCLTSTACRHRARPWLCTVCGKGYSLKATLNTHMKTHDPEKLFKCTECPKSFVKKQSFQSHMKWHAGEEPQYKCDQCPQSYFNVFALKRHYMKHTSQRNFICEICSKAFWMKDALKVHMRSHTNVKPFQCPKCPKAFAHKHTLEGHLKNHRTACSTVPPAPTVQEPLQQYQPTEELLPTTLELQSPPTTVIAQLNPPSVQQGPSTAATVAAVHQIHHHHLPTSFTTSSAQQFLYYTLPPPLQPAATHIALTHGDHQNSQHTLHVL